MTPATHLQEDLELPGSSTPGALSSCILRHSAVEDLSFLAKLSHQGVPTSVAIVLATVLEHVTNDIN